MSRDISLDTVSGILILWMIYEHYNVSSGLYLSFAPPFLFCFMAWFFFKSGMFHKQKKDKEIVIHGWKRLIIPYLSFTMIGFFTGIIVKFINNDLDFVHYTFQSVWQIAKMGGVNYCMPIWFLLSLYFVRLLFNVFINKRIHPITIAFSSFIIADILYRTGMKYPCYLGNVALGICFYSLGYVLKKMQYDNRLFVLAILIYSPIYILIPSNVDVRANICNMGYYEVYYISAICSIIILNNLFRRIQFLNIKIIQSIGRDSMTYYLTHWGVMSIVMVCITRFASQSDAMSNFICLIVVSAVVLPLLNRLLHKEKFRLIIGE